MTAARIAVTAALALVTWMIDPAPLSAADIQTCVEFDKNGICLEWVVTTPGDESDRGTGDNDQGPSGGVVCYWVDISPIDEHQLIDDFDLPEPPPDVAIQWQEWECSDGSTQFNFRWVIDPPVTPEGLATTARGRLVSRLPTPDVATSPPPGVAAIVGTPVFVEVANWTGPIVEQSCAGGLCVTATAVPSLTFRPGELNAAPVFCAGSGSRHQPGADPLVEAAADGACTHIYRLRSGVEGRPNVWPGVVSVTWSIGWTASNGASGSLASITQSADVPRAVEEVQTVVVGGGTP